jgi:hypothetical protein
MPPGRTRPAVPFGTNVATNVPSSKYSCISPVSVLASMASTKYRLGAATPVVMAPINVLAPVAEHEPSARQSSSVSPLAYDAACNGLDSFQFRQQYVAYVPLETAISLHLKCGSDSLCDLVLRVLRRGVFSAPASRLPVSKETMPLQSPIPALNTGPYAGCRHE